MQREIKHTFYFSQTPEEVWDYLTKPELMAQWLMPSDFKPVVGHHFRFTNPNNTFVVCQVLEVKPFTNLVYEWQPDDYKVSEIMQAFFVSFIKTGDPNGLGVPEWPAVDNSKAIQVMHIDVETKVVADKYRERYLFLNQSIKK